MGKEGCKGAEGKKKGSRKGERERGKSRPEMIEGEKLCEGRQTKEKRMGGKEAKKNF